MQIDCADMHLKMFFRTHVNMCSLGRELLESRPGFHLAIRATANESTHFYGVPAPTIHVNLGGEAARGSSKEVSSALVHELIHAIHRFDDPVAYRTRNQTGSANHSFPNQEEELTITGEVLGTDVRAPLCCENWARRWMSLPERVDYT